MVESYRRRSPLASFGLPARAAAQSPEAVADADLQLGERPHRCQINLRGNPQDGRFLEAVRNAAGLALPTEPNRVAAAGELKALWLGPDEWLILGPGGRETELVGTLARGLQGQHAGATDVSEARTWILVAGGRARALLARGIPLDLHPREFRPGHCAQTGLAGANIILQQTDDRPSYEIGVTNSFADHLWHWLERGAIDYRVAISV